MTFIAIGAISQDEDVRYNRTYFVKSRYVLNPTGLDLFVMLLIQFTKIFTDFHRLELLTRGKVWKPSRVTFKFRLTFVFDF